MSSSLHPTSCGAELGELREERTWRRPRLKPWSLPVVGARARSQLGNERFGPNSILASPHGERLDRRVSSIGERNTYLEMRTWSDVDETKIP